jgi:putative DNA primase/helicase
VLTSEERKERVLGRSEEVRLLNRTVVFATGSNLTMSGDLAARRALLISIDPGCESPETRHFDFDPVRRAAEFYPELVVAALTALRAYIVAGKPKVLGRALLGSFELWDELVCGTLVWCGFADPCSTRGLLKAADPQHSRDIELLSLWYEELKGKPISLANLFKEAGAVRQLLVSQFGDGASEKVRWRLTKLENRIVDGYKLVVDRTISSRVVHYEVIRVGEATQQCLLEPTKEVF